MSDAFETNMRIIAGENLQPTQEKQLSDADKKKISESYFQLFFNLTYTNWLRGKSLGEAWYASLQQIKQFVESKKGNNNAALYLRQIFASHKAKWAQVIMTSKHRDDVLQATPEQKQKWAQRAAQNTTAALNALGDIIKTYSQPTQDNKKTQNAQPIDFKVAAQKMQMLIMLKARNREKGAAA